METTPIEVSWLAHDVSGKPAFSFFNRAPVLTVIFDQMSRGE
jgi:hypothetical protein